MKDILAELMGEWCTGVNNGMRRGCVRLCWYLLFPRLPPRWINF